jgi:FixJ family two-component response regulator
VLALVDDDDALRHALTFSFETAGIGVEAFALGEAALAARNRSKWRCLVADYRLPGISGLELLERLRLAGVNPPTILITSNPSRELKFRSSVAGVEIVEKPLLGDQLLQSVLNLLKAPA